MKRVSFCDYDIICSTYSADEYDRSNNDLPTLLLKYNAKDFGGEYMYELNNIYDDLMHYKNTEMKEAFEISHAHKLFVVN
jgi:hypothetical protein